jgi:hypothetical protein
MSEDRTRLLFAAVDTKDAGAFGAFLADDARLTFGNAEPLVGLEAIVAGIAAFFSTIDGLGRNGRVAWSTGTWAAGPSTLVVRDDGNVVLRRDRDGAIVWSSMP